MNNRFFRKTSLNNKIASTYRSRGILRHACRSEIEPLEGRLLFSTYTVTNLADSGIGSLRYEVAQANAHAGADTVAFASGLHGRITLASGQIEISDTSGATTIQGPGAATLGVSGNNASRVFQVDAKVAASISGLSLFYGKAPTAVVAGGFAGGGIILSLGSVQLLNDQLTSSHATATGTMVGGALFLYNASSTPASSVTNCIITGNSATACGGAIFNFGGTLNTSGNNFSSNVVTMGAGGAIGAGINGPGVSAIVNVTSSNFSGNQALDVSNFDVAQGGAIASLTSSTLSITKSTFSKNYAAGYGGAIWGQGGMTVSGSAFQANQSGEGGNAIRNDSGSGLVTSCTFTGNLGGVAGGAILSSGHIAVVNSMFTLNVADNNGGAIENDNTGSITGCTFYNNSVSINPSDSGGAVNNESDLTIYDSTFVANTANQGGAVSNEGAITVDDCTITGNTAVQDQSQGAGGGLYSAVNTTATLNNSIVSGNVHTVYMNPSVAPVADDISGSVPGGANLIGAGDSGGLANGVNGNIVGAINPLLAPLANNGGPTETAALLAGSPAAGAGNKALLPSGLTTDQRGLPRVVNGLLDIGAFENQDGTLTGTVFNDANGNGLRDSGEAGIGNVRVFLDYNGNGVWDSKTEPSVLTNSSGAFTFSNIPALSYKVAQVLPGGYLQTTPTGDLVVTVVANKTTTGSFGDIQIAAGTGTVAGVVYNDHNVNGVQDPGDAGLANVKVFLDLNHNGVFDAGEPYVLTGPTGAYVFSNLKPGTYSIGQVVPANYRQGFPFGGLENSVTVTANSSTTGVDFGDTTTSRVSGFVYVDLNSTGTGPGKTGINDAAVVVQPTNGQGPVYTVMTDSAGYFVVGALPNGLAYTVTLQPPMGYTLTSGSLTRTTAVLGSGQTADNIVFIGSLATPVVFTSEDRFVTESYAIDTNYYPNPGYPAMTQTANGFAAFNGSVSGSKSVSFTLPNGQPDSIQLDAAASQTSSLTPSEISASGESSAYEDDGSAGSQGLGESNATGDSHFQTTFTLYAAQNYSFTAMTANHDGYSAATFSIIGPGGVPVITPPFSGNQFNNDPISQTGKLAVGTYTIMVDVTSTDYANNGPSASFSFDLKLG